MFSTSISAAAAEAHINDLLAEANTARRVRLARQATAARRADRRRPSQLRTSWVLRTGRLAPEVVRSLVRARRAGRIAPTAAVCLPGDADA